VDTAHIGEFVLNCLRAVGRVAHEGCGTGLHTSWRGSGHSLTPGPLISDFIFLTLFVLSCVGVSMEILEVIFPVAALVIFGGTAYVVGKASKRWRKDFDEAMTKLEEEHE